MVRIFATVAAVGFLIVSSAAEAQIVRHIIGHAVAGKAVKSILGQDKNESGKEAEVSAPSSGEGARAADGALPQDPGSAQTTPNR